MNIEKKDLDQLNFLIKNERFEDALDIFSKVKTLNSYQAQYLKAIALEGVEKYQESLELLKRLHQQNPENLNVVNKVADISEKLGMSGQAREYYERILFLDPFNKTAKEKMETLKDMPPDGPEADAGTPVDKESQEAPEAGGEDKPSIEFEKINIGEEIDRKVSVDEDRFTGGSEDTGEVGISKTGDDTDEPVVEVRDDPPDILGDSAELEEKTEPPQTPEATEKAKDNLRDMIGGEDIDSYFTSTSKPDTGEASPETAAEEDPGSGKDPEFGFVTESAARLYEKQQLYEEAVAVYEKLEQKNNTPGSYGEDIARLSRLKKYQRMVESLTRLKERLTKGVQSV